MNEFLGAAFIERVDRLMLGIEPLDAMRGGRIAQPIEVALDAVRAGFVFPAAQPAALASRLGGFGDAIGARRRIPRHNSNRHALSMTVREATTTSTAIVPPIAIRLVDAERRFVPRRIRYPAPGDLKVAAPRVRRPALYPGAAYAVSDTATGLRGRVTWHASPVDEVQARWVRVEATIDGHVVGLAHGDDRGEFLLLLSADAGGIGELPSMLVAKVTVFGPAAPVAVAIDDPLSDLPLEILGTEPDVVSPGTLLPAGYASTGSSSRSVTFELGQLLTGQAKFFFNP